MIQNIEKVHLMETSMTEEDLLKIIANRKALVVTDSQVFHFHGNRFPGLPFVVVPSGEEAKSFKQYLKLIDTMAMRDLDRDDYIIALGGGVVGDLAGYAAATFKRGIQLIQIPTTLLAMVDSSIGGKVGINHQGGKNNVGTFYKAQHVIIDSSFLETLPLKEMQNGMAEVLKYAIGFKPALLEVIGKTSSIVQEIVLPCIEIKRQTVSIDEKDLSERRLLNFGHTIGHAIEQEGAFKTLSHGEAVAIGMAYQLKHALLKGRLTVADFEKIMALYHLYALPKKIKQEQIKSIIEQMHRDKKNKEGKIHWIELVALGELKVVAVTPNEVFEIFNKCDFRMVKPVKLKGIVKVPPSKSYAHRAIISAALSADESIIGPLSLSEDICSTMEAMKKFGAVFTKVDGKHYRVTNHQLQNADKACVIDCAESGSTLRFLVPFSIFFKEITFTGRGRLGDRPLTPYYDIFDEQAVNYQTSNGKLPLTIKGGISPGVFFLPGNVSSQFFTGLMFVLPLLAGDSEIISTSYLESEPYVALTRDVLRDFGIVIDKKANGHYQVKGNQVYRGCDYQVEGDYSQAAFWLVANTLGSDIELAGILSESKQGDSKIKEILQLFDQTNQSVRKIDVRNVPDLLPILAVKAAVTEGVTIIVGAERVRLKESDRVKAIAIELKKMGAQIEERSDGLEIYGISHFKGAHVDAWQDHRIAMALAIASTMAEGPLYLKGADSVKKSYPDFWCHFEKLGGQTYE